MTLPTIDDGVAVPAIDANQARHIRTLHAHGLKPRELRALYPALTKNRLNAILYRLKDD